MGKYIDENLDTDIIIQFMLDWLIERQYQGIVPVKITYARYVKHRDEISFKYDYKPAEGCKGSTGNTGYNMPMVEYNNRLRKKKIDKILE